MPIDPKILLNKIKNLKDRVRNIDFSDVFVAALNTGNAMMQQRIFQENKDVLGNGFGEYIGEKKFLTDRQKKRLLGSTQSRTTLARIQRNIGRRLTPYQRKRVNRGRQIVRKDLELEGELRRSIEVQVINERAAALMFNNDKAVLVAKGQENQITNIRETGRGSVYGNGVKIFALNDNERKQVLDQVRLITRNEIQRSNITAGK